MRVYKPHRGILIDKIPSQGFAGLIFTIGIMVILLVGIPQVRLLFVGSLLAGSVLAGALYFWHNQTRW